MNAAVLEALSTFTSAGSWQDRREMFRDLAETLRPPDALGLLARRALLARKHLLECSPDEIEAVYADSERLHHAGQRFLNAGTEVFVGTLVGSRLSRAGLQRAPVSV